MIEEEILYPIIQRYFNLSLEQLKSGVETRERIGTVRNMQIIIYSDDHNPPHFHVKSKDNEVNAKFKIENCEYISGTISSKDRRRIELFYRDPKTKIVMKRIWDKKLQ